MPVDSTVSKQTSDDTQGGESREEKSAAAEGGVFSPRGATPTTKATARGASGSLTELVPIKTTTAPKHHTDGSDGEHGADDFDTHAALNDDLSTGFSPSGSPMKKQTKGMDPTHTLDTFSLNSAHEDDEEHAELFHENRCLRCINKVVNTIVPHGGVVSNVYNLASATLGAGIVSVPSGFHDSGIIVSSVLLVVVCLCTIYSLRLLAMTTRKTGLKSYEEMARGLLGIGWDYFTAFLMFIFCWGTCVGYVISVGDLLTPMLDSPNTNSFLKTPTGKRCLMALVWLVGMFTLSLPKEINSLRYASVVGVSFVIFFVICVIIHSAQHGLRHGVSSDLNLATSGMEAVNGLSLFIFAYIVQVNEPEIFDEMKKPTARKMTRDSAISMSLVCLLNFLSGFFGYCDFGEKVTGSILLLYKPRQDPLFMVAYIGICIKLCVGFAICIQPSRDAIYYCLGWGRTEKVTYWINWLVSGFLALAALICGMFIPNINIVFSLLGGICGGFLGFMFPAYFFIYAGGFTLRKVGIWNYLGCIVLIVGGVVAVVFGTAAAIYSEVQDP